VFGFHLKIYNDGRKPAYPVLDPKASYIFVKARGDTNPGHGLDTVFTVFNQMVDFGMLDWAHNQLVFHGKPSRQIREMKKYWHTLTRTIRLMEDFPKDQTLPLVLLTTGKCIYCR
jgi:hypothetical protein